MRAVHRIVAALLAAAICAAGVIVLLEIVYAALDRKPAVLDWRRIANASARNSWNDLGPRIAAGVLIAVGLLLVLLGLRRGKPSALPLRSEAPGAASSTDRRSLQRALRARALGTPGVSGAKVRVGRRRVTIVATARPRAAEGLDERVRQRLSAQLEGLRLADPPRLRVRTRVAG